jgi:hypothetical protein
MTGKQFFVRSALTVSLPVILIWAFVEALCHGLRSAFRAAWLEARINLEDYHRHMEREDY